MLSEPAVYKLAFRSNKPEADAFTNWVASEVLPAIRKTGKYEAASKPLPPSKPTMYNTPAVIEGNMTALQNELFQKTNAFTKDMEEIARRINESFSHPQRISNVGTPFDVFAYEQSRVMIALAEQAYHCGSIALRQMRALSLFAPHLKEYFG